MSRAGLDSLQPSDGALYFGLLRAEVWFTEYKGRRQRIGWLCWFHNGSHWRWSAADGWTQVWGLFKETYD